MQRIVCGQTQETISLDSLLRGEGEDAAVLALSEKLENASITLSLSEGSGFRAMASYLHNTEEAFPIPGYASSFQAIPASYFILTESDGCYTAFVCLSRNGLHSVLKGCEHGLHVQISKRGLATQENALVIVRGTRLMPAIHSAIRLALQSTGEEGKMLDEKIPIPDWLNRFGWSTRISLGNEVSHEKILFSLSALKEAGFCPGYVMIDEGWQHLENPEGTQGERAMAGFDADPVLFPRGLKGLIEDIHRLGINYVGVWHAMMGSRGGIHPRLAMKYKLSRNSSGMYILGNNLTDAFQFFNDFYHYLGSQGVSFVIVGDQRYPLYSKNIQSAMQASASLHLIYPHFNTDCMMNENLFFWTTSNCARVSENIDLENPLGAMRAIRNGLTNALWMQHIVHPDFDAWTTLHSQSEMLAIFHALSGCDQMSIGDLRRTMIPTY